MLHSDSWKQFKIKDIASIGRGRVISSVEISQQDNPLYPVYSSQTSNEGIRATLTILCLRVNTLIGQQMVQMQEPYFIVMVSLIVQMFVAY